MRALTAGAIVAGFVGLGVLVLLAGRTVAPASDPQSVAAHASGEMFGPPMSADFEPLEPEAEVDGAQKTTRAVAPSLVAPPPVKYDALVRAAPRDPLGPLGQALPPPKPRDKGGTLLYRPVATASAEFEAMGYRIAIAGTESIDPGETCMHDGVAWNCGTRARTAVRLWLRSRALACDMPPQADRAVVVVGCRLGKQDVGAWLVANGWARAAAGGPYAEAEAKAREARMGIFGPPPSTTN
jgi:endonuclease YncB( thermonuclease family)